MERKKSLLLPVAIAAVVIVALMVVAALTGNGNLEGTFWSLVPPFIAIALALITKEVYSSLFIGVLSGAVLASKFSFTGSVNILVKDGIIDAVAGNAGIFVFLVELGIIVALVNKSGAAKAFGRWAEKHIKTKVGALLATFVLGVLIFIDDYFNCLTVGAVMSPVTDSKKISRAKLAYLIDATAAPICMIAPISSWAAAVSSNVDPETAGMTGLELFVRAIPFNFYSLLTLVFVIALSIMGYDYGKMSGFEIKAQSGELGVSDTARSEEVAENPRARVIDMILPIVILVVISVLALIYVGGFFGTDIWGGTDCAGDFIAAFGNTDSTVGLPWGGLLSLVLIIVYYMIRRIITFEESMKSVPEGFVAMVPAILILTFANALKNVTVLLDSDAFVRGLMEGAEGLQMFLPAIIFVVACIIAFATGTSWGTFGILIPIVLSVFPMDSDLLFVGISACLAGAVCGDHCSPISDTTIMASAGAQCNHVDHVSSQLPYAITVAGLSFVMFIVAGLVPNALICLPVGAALTVGTLFLIRFLEGKKAGGNGEAAEAETGAQDQE